MDAATPLLRGKSRILHFVVFSTEQVHDLRNSVIDWWEFQAIWCDPEACARIKERGDIGTLWRVSNDRRPVVECATRSSKSHTRVYHAQSGRSNGRAYHSGSVSSFRCRIHSTCGTRGSASRTTAAQLCGSPTSAPLICARSIT
jgi:hypothetical protein